MTEAYDIFSSLIGSKKVYHILHGSGFSKDKVCIIQIYWFPVLIQSFAFFIETFVSEQLLTAESAGVKP